MTFEEHCLEQYPMEAVGIVVKGEYMPLANIASDPINQFEVEEGVFLTYEKDIEIILHSHTMESFVGDPRRPSKADMLLAEATELPCGIVHCDGEGVTPILDFTNTREVAYLDRVYTYNVYDCYTLCRDYYKNTFNLDLPLLPREPDWATTDIGFFERCRRETDLVEVSLDNLVIGDMLLFKVGSPHTTHAGIYLGEGEFMHHYTKRKSNVDKVAKWHRQLWAAYRRKV